MPGVVAPVTFLRSVLRGVGQVMFQRSAITGALFLLGILVASPLMALGALLGSAVGTLTAIVWRWDRTEIRDGIYGFNSTLVGIALLFYDRPTLLTFCLVLLGSVGAAIVTRLMRQLAPFPTYTAPFIVTTWIVLAAATPLGVFAGPPASATPPTSLFNSITEGVSEVMFQASPWTGLLFLTGISTCSVRQGVWAAVGSIIGLLVASWHGDPAADISSGIYGYNAALAALALWLYRPSLVFPAVAAVLSVPMTEAFPHTGLETLTAPFVLASWLAIAVVQLDDLVRGSDDLAH